MRDTSGRLEDYDANYKDAWGDHVCGVDVLAALLGYDDKGGSGYLFAEAAEITSKLENIIQEATK